MHSIEQGLRLQLHAYPILRRTARGMKRQAVLRSAEMALIGCRKLDLGAKDSIFDPLTLHQQSLRFNPFESRHPPTSGSLLSCYELHLLASSTAPPYSMALQTPKLAQWFVDRLKVGYVELDPSHNADSRFYSSSSFVSNSFHSTIIFLYSLNIRCRSRSPLAFVFPDTSRFNGVARFRHLLLTFSAYLFASLISLLPGCAFIILWASLVGGYSRAL